MKKIKPLSEYDIQRLAVAAVRMRWPDMLIQADSSGVRMSIGQAVKMKRMGRIAGWPDLFIPGRSGEYCGLFIEMKTPDGTVSAEQKKIHEELKKRWYSVVVCRSVQDVIEAVKNYFWDV